MTSSVGGSLDDWLHEGLAEWLLEFAFPFMNLPCIAAACKCLLECLSGVVM